MSARQNIKNMAIFCVTKRAYPTCARFLVSWLSKLVEALMDKKDAFLLEV